MKFFENVLSHDTLLSYFKEIKSLLHHYSRWAPSDIRWQEPLRKYVPGSCLCTSASKELKLSILNDIQLSLPFANAERVVIQHYVWLKNSGINWHEDGKYSYGATIYLNKGWDANYGGIFVWKDSNQKRVGKLNAYSPVFNSMVLNDQHNDHLVTMVSPFAPENRFTLQIWGLQQKDK